MMRTDCWDSVRFVPGTELFLQDRQFVLSISVHDGTSHHSRETLRELIWHFYKGLKAYRRRPSAPVLSDILHPDRVWRSGQMAVSTEAPQARTAAGSGAARNAAADERLGKRSARVCHQAQDLGWHGQPQRPTGAQQHAWIDEDLSKARPVVLALSWRSVGHWRTGTVRSSAGMMIAART